MGITQIHKLSRVSRMKELDSPTLNRMLDNKLFFFWDVGTNNLFVSLISYILITFLNALKRKYYYKFYLL